VPHHCKKVPTLSDQIAALRESVRKNGRHAQPHTRHSLPGRETWRSRLEAGRKGPLQAVVLAPDARSAAPKPWITSRDTAHSSRGIDDAESTVDDGHSVLSYDSVAALNTTTIVPENSQTPAITTPNSQRNPLTDRFLWTQAGIDSLRRQGRWEEYDRPEVSHEITDPYLQLLRDTNKLEAMLRAKFLVASEETESEEEEEAWEIDDPFSMLTGMGAEEIYKVTLFSEVLGGDASSAHLLSKVAATSAPALALGVGDEVARYRWTQAGIDKLRRQRKWKEYGSPEAGNEVVTSQLQLLRDTGKLEHMVREQFFAHVEEADVEEEGCDIVDPFSMVAGTCAEELSNETSFSEVSTANAVQESCGDWEPPCMMCANCHMWWGKTSVS